MHFDLNIYKKSKNASKTIIFKKKQSFEAVSLRYVGFYKKTARNRLCYVAKAKGKATAMPWLSKVSIDSKQSSKQGSDSVGDGRDVESEVVEDVLGRCGASIGVLGDDVLGKTVEGISFSHFDEHPLLIGVTEDFVLIGFRLREEDFDGRHGDHSDVDAVLEKLSLDVAGKVDFGSGRNDGKIRLLLLSGDDISAEKCFFETRFGIVSQCLS